MDFFAERATRELIVTEYAVQAQNHVETLRARLDEARAQVDALQELPELVATLAHRPVPTADAAFLVWKQTVLARERLTSNVELYDAEGKLVSPFALNVPDYSGTTTQRASGCGWVTWGEVSPFGAEERRMLHAERGICAPDDSGGRPARHGDPSRRLRFRDAAVHHVAESVLRNVPLRRARVSGGRVGSERGSGDLRLGSPAALHLGPVGMANHRRPRSRDCIARAEPFWAEASTGGVRTASISRMIATGSSRSATRS